MKLLSFYEAGQALLGVKTEEGVIHIPKAADQANEAGIARTIMQVLEGGEAAYQDLSQFVDRLLASTDRSAFVEEAELTFAPVVTEPKKIICVGLNYKKHADETKSPYPTHPVLFNKFHNALSGHLEEVPIPATTERVDYEVELAIVIGKRAKYVSEAKALSYVFGYCTANDLSARDLQKRSGQWMTGKTLDGFAPIGPYLVTKDEVENPNQLDLWTKVNGEMRQSSNTRDMIFSVEELVSYISHYMTLEPGDLILTGTPEGVIIGRPMEERVYLQAGDEVTVEVEHLGALTTKFVQES